MIEPWLKDSYLLLDDEIDKKIDVTTMQFLLVQNRQQTRDWTLIGSDANGIGIHVCSRCFLKKDFDETRSEKSQVKTFVFLICSEQT